VRQLEEANFFISSKVLLAASLLLRLKSEILLHEFLPNLDDLLYGRKDEKHVYKQERITLDEEIPGLVPRTPLPRYRKVTLEELMQALGKAINTETRRIRKVVIAKQQEFETAIALPKHRINLKDRIQEVYSKLQDIFKEREEKLAFTDFIANNTKEDKITTFVPLLHLDYQQKVWLEQHKHFDEIWILLKHLYEKQNKELLAQMKKEVEEEMKKYAQEMSEEDKEKAEKINEEFSNPIGESV